MRHVIRLFTCLILVLGISSLSYGQTNIGFKGVGAKLGFVGPEGGVDNTIAFGGIVDLGNITEMIKFGAFVEYWSKSVGAADFSALAIAATGTYNFPMEGSKLSPYVSAGLGFTRAKVGVEINLGPFGGGSGSVSTTDFAFNVAGGVELPLSPKMTGRAEFKYNIGGIDYWGIFAGVLFALGQ